MSLTENTIGVITGDIVASSKRNREDLLQHLKEILAEINALQPTLDLPFEIYRGDSFQGMVLNPEETLRYALLIRTNLKKKAASGGRDARIAIGIGKVDYIAKSISESDGEAFRNSGPVLDNLKQENIGLKIKTPWTQINREFDVSLLLADAIIKRWTVAQVEVISETLMGKKQREIAEKLNISQSAVNQRLKAGSWNAISELVNRFNTIIKAAIKQP